MKTVSELKAYLAKLPDAPSHYRIAVGSLLFSSDDKVILLERGAAARDAQGQLEGVGGEVDEGENNLHAALQREVKEEIGDVKIQIDKMLTVKIMPSSKDPNLQWVVVDYLCRLVNGVPCNMEPHKCAAIHELALAEIPQDRLSEYQLRAMNAYNERYGSVPYYK